jgi:hypothetical protein
MGELRNSTEYGSVSRALESIERYTGRAPVIFAFLYTKEKNPEFAKAMIRKRILKNPKRLYLYRASCWFLKKRIAHLPDQVFWPWFWQGRGRRVLKQAVAWYLFYRWDVSHTLFGDPDDEEMKLRIRHQTFV